MEPFSLQALGQSINDTAPLFFLLGLGLVLMLLDAFKVKTLQHWLGIAGLLGSAGWVLINARPGSATAFFGMIETGAFAPIIHAFLCFSGALTLFFTEEYLRRHERPISEVSALLVLGTIGMILMATANDLAITFIGLETMSMALYIFASLFKTDQRSNEAGLKYFLLGSFASAFLLFGISLIYGLTGYTNFTAIAANLTPFQDFPEVFMAAVGLLLVGFLFKVSAFPFHNWTPDVYTGTPTPLAGFMATAGKMTAFVSLGVIMLKFQLYGHPKIVMLLAVASLLTMVYGNLVAARQTNVKRMLAYSSIAHSGYLLLGLCAVGIGFSAVVFYLAIYTLMNLGAFALVGMTENTPEDLESNSWKGMSRRNPGLAAAMAVFLFSLAGIPPLAGFMGKYQVFLAAIDGGWMWLAIIGILASVVGAYYYLRVIFLMYFSREGSDEPVILSGMLPYAGAAVLALLVVALGVFPFLLLQPIEQGLAGLVETARGFAGR